MTMTQEMVKQGLRESNLIAITADPTAAQLEEGLAKLQSIVSSVFGHEVGERLEDWPIGTTGVDEYRSNWSQADWSTPPTNVRLLMNSSASETIELEPMPQNGARIQLVDIAGDLANYPIRIDGNGRLIEDAAYLDIAVPGINREWLYRGDLGKWVVITDLVLEDDFPFPTKYDDYFQTMLAGRLNPRYGRTLDQQSVQMLQRSLGHLRSDFRQTRNVRLDPALSRRSDTPSGRGGTGYSGRRYGWMN